MKLRIIVNTPVGTFTSDIMELAIEEKEALEEVLKKSNQYLTIYNNGNSTFIQSETLKNSVITLETISE